MFLFFLTLLLPCPAHADDLTATTKLSEAKALYAQRADLAKVDEALAALATAQTEAQSPDLQYDVLILSSACQYWKGRNATTDQDKLNVFDQGYRTAKAARAINPDYAEALYWSAANLARWAEVNGILASLDKKQELDETLNGIFDRFTRDGKAGDDYEADGADRTMGRIYFKAPPFAGGSLALALQHLERAYSKVKTHILTVMWYAEALYQGDAASKQKARDILDEMLAQDPHKLDPDRVPETLFDWDNAKKLRAQMGR